MAALARMSAGTHGPRVFVRLAELVASAEFLERDAQERAPQLAVVLDVVVHEECVVQ